MVYDDADTSQLNTEPELSNDVLTRLSQTPIGRKALTALIGLLALAVAVPNLPSGPFTDGVDVLWSPVTSLGVRQNWHVFSPNPRAFSVETKAVITHDDGSLEIWQIPKFDPAIGSYREYRWRKWEEDIGGDRFEDYWEPTALWIADQHLRDGVRPAQVTLVERKRPHRSVATFFPIDGDWTEEVYFTWERDG